MGRIWRQSCLVRVDIPAVNYLRMPHALFVYPFADQLKGNGLQPHVQSMETSIAECQKDELIVNGHVHKLFIMQWSGHPIGSGYFRLSVNLLSAKKLAAAVQV